MKCFIGSVPALAALLLATVTSAAAVKPGDEVTPENASLVQDLVSPGNFILVKQGMRMKIVPTERLELPPPYNSATEKYSLQVKLNDRGELESYVAGLPFPLLDPNDPQAATKVMWNFSFRPQYTDDVDVRDVELESNKAGKTIDGSVEYLEIGHFAFYNSIGRTEVQPIPTDAAGNGAKESATVSARFRSWSRQNSAASDWFAIVTRTQESMTTRGTTIPRPGV
jgi:hypothetical protein